MLVGQARVLPPASSAFGYIWQVQEDQLCIVCRRFWAYCLATFLFASVVLAQTCPGGGATIRALQARVKADQESIKRLGAGLSSTDLEEWASAAEKWREEIVNRSLRAAISNLADSVLALPENAQDPMSIAGYPRKEGPASVERTAHGGQLAEHGLAGRSWR